MECNKEEAIRAKGIAEKKMESKDFLGARKIALKAQLLYPDLENISQMIMVCDVHCSAENKVYGNEKDWYGILQVQPTADEASIKRQYRKFALSLHPDKNKFAGAADAFKLIGEAQRVLLDREKRMLHDTKCRASRPMAQNWASQPSTCNSNAGRQPWVKNHSMSKVSSPFTAFNPQQQQAQKQSQPGFPNERQTFWTVCPFCSVRYQFYREVVNRLLYCQSCKRSFTGYEIKTQATTPGANSSQPAFQQQNNVCKANMQVPKAGASGNASSLNQTGQSFSRSGNSSFNRESKANEKHTESKLGKVNANKRKRVAESSESCSTESSSDSEEEIAIEENGDAPDKHNLGCYGEKPRRSSRSKRHVSYSENLSDEDDVSNPSKRTKCNESLDASKDPLMYQEEAKVKKPDNHCRHTVRNFNEVRQNKSEEDLENGIEENEKEKGDKRATKDGRKASESNGEFSLDSSPSEARDPEIYEYPDPDFNDFDEDRKEECFKVGQIWAVYDTLDAMPRFYARIRKVFSSSFKLRITWLEPDPDDEDEIKWVEEGLPVSCGKFRHGNTENTEDHPMFSHLLYWEKGSRTDTYKIYPRKGETWALFRNWDMRWHSTLEPERKYEFDFVEVLSDYAEEIGVSVAYLGKIKGLSCLFCRTVKEGVGPFQIPPNQLFRFSHRVPSYPMTGEEREDVPKGSFELDPASLPTNLEEIAVTEDMTVGAAKIHSDVSCSELPKEKLDRVTTSEANVSGCQVNKESKLDSDHINTNNCTEDPDDDLPFTPEPFEIPEPEFHNFEVDKFPDKFQIGQIWALYSDEDGLPKYYAQIKKIDRHPEFKLHVQWLTPCPPKNMIQWVDRKMLVSCSIFKLQKGATDKYTETSPFSHQLRVEHTDKKDVYAIYPKKGEIWALYKNWNPRIKHSELKTCEYDIVEILEENDFGICALVLERVNGFNSVFKAQKKGGSDFTMGIARNELLRFSHQVPAFQLTEERGGILRGSWELDTAALPVTFFH